MIRKQKRFRSFVIMNQHFFPVMAPFCPQIGFSIVAAFERNERTKIVQ